MFKELEDIKPEYMAVAFDLKAPTFRHKLYDGYKANRKGMPNELAEQMPILKEILRAMNIKIIEKEGFEADDILGTISTVNSRKVETTILTGDRDSFQLIKKNVKVRIPRTKMGKTETEDYTVEKIRKEYGLQPKQLIELKGLMGDSADNIPGVPGVGEKTALELIKKYKNIEEVYNNIEEITGKLKDKLVENKELAFLSRTLGIIDTNIDIEKDLELLKIKEWNNQEVYELFKKLKFSRYIERFNLSNSAKPEKNQDYSIQYEEKYNLEKIKKEIIEEGKLCYYINKKDGNGLIIDKHIEGITIFIEKENKTYLIKSPEELKEIFENKKILKIRL